MADINLIAKQFTDYYYSKFDTNRSELAPLYRDHSMLTFESAQTAGAAAIVEKLVSLPFETVQHRVTTLDAQPASSEKASLIVLVTGQLITGDEANALNFSQTFHLVPEGTGYYVYNDIFRLVYG